MLYIIIYGIKAETLPQAEAKILKRTYFTHVNIQLLLQAQK